LVEEGAMEANAVAAKGFGIASGPLDGGSRNRDSQYVLQSWRAY